ncbi:MAG TPA: AarF/UbiB family protein [Terriglobia bacterium]|nr:AarF/UbiB family protein [Terriglobia bacterium]
MPTRVKIDQESLQVLEPLLRAPQTAEDRISAVVSALQGHSGRAWRRQLARWALRVLPVEALVPDVYCQWRPVVREAMQFVVRRLSAARLAPKVVEQMALPPDTPVDARLLRFIAKVPGLQKLGQVLARNRHLDPNVRRALTQLENSIADVTPGEIRALIRRELGPILSTFQVELDPGILSEASVSAVVRFRWRNPDTRRRERGVFKVLKPYVPGCYAEDMKILQQLAAHLARKPSSDGIRMLGVSETLTGIRRLLEHEVDFRREQTTLVKALRLYRAVPGIRVPHVIPPLSTALITALSEETGTKVTTVFSRPGKSRRRVAERLAEALLAVPALAHEREAIFHADPHAGNLLYDQRRDELVILDWALTERLNREQRKNILMLVLMLLLRDAQGIVKAVENLCAPGTEGNPERTPTIRRQVARCLYRLPVLALPDPMEAMRLLDRIALKGIRFPPALLMFRKAFFTLDGVLADIAGSSLRLDSVMARYAATHPLDAGATLLSLLSIRDWLALDWSAATFAARVCSGAVSGPWAWPAGFLPELPDSTAARSRKRRMITA